MELLTAACLMATLLISFEADGAALALLAGTFGSRAFCPAANCDYCGGSRCGTLAPPDRWCVGHRSPVCEDADQYRHEPAIRGGPVQPSPALVF